MSPHDHDIDVSRGSLQYQASIWGRVAEELGKVSSEVSKLDPVGNPGPFAEFVNQYLGLSEDIGIWTGGGKSEMNKIARALQECVGVYDNTEQHIMTNIRSIKN